MSLSFYQDQLLINSLEQQELPRAVEIYNSNPNYNVLTNGEPTLTLAELSREYEDANQYPTGHWLAIRYEDKIIGISHILLENPNDQKPWIGLLLIDSSYQGKGYGKKAYLMLEEYFRSLDKKTVHIGVITSNQRALDFWGKLGFEQYRQVTASVGKLTQPVLCMAKFL
ncbi:MULTISPECIES: GNAT family N-acetyltransferase [Brevibacillus]|uniref:Acetyltransferase (GNAT) family protein n=1 Tax=Brevibacillus laterosporus LMG 15441 TaxID=1042163 RepID=A0A075QZM2_BRELA|nr:MULTISPECIES: GNAT family N-acetyltransferase [Brevibacillus]AIG25044.1 acetyltransferase (GNAT) family protein [Brevibacillus laterosporus LMG 15441]AUM63666.1 N-acetyltransferase [Brevibacillus laterosporus]AYK06670.1 GNAT family N-acetyltransferase [Brevibacillus laterosporus]ERM17674.1 acetyltransferase [Brevibacillus laterosporus PE36]MBA4534735.1 GNAT family N-acetyltransferase [Brevibacillus halotolerans]